MLTSIKGHLTRSINKAGIYKQVEAARVCDLWGEIIENMFNADVAKGSKALKCKGGVITIAVLSSVLAQELKFKEQEIIEAINKKAGAGAVRKIRFEV